ncbi:hypothetical protein BXU11_15940 [Flavobacterium sp. LM5]|uniref:hypothetical protein n=1 Tax=Flavobacterium sp. LM5 TaxID=1938610 RepID=UPI0009946485|nr:hypothetical protein [Flavobacterium sp. LM5]OOV25040.1 hypothetical protein BXU11_15940 [Flavobacterium sp. LM5]
MRNQKLTFIFLLLNTFLVLSQTSIPSELMNKPRTEELYRTNDSNVKNMTVSETNFLKNETYTNKWIYNYSNDSIINGRLFKNEELKSIFEYIIDDNKEIIESKVVFYHNSLINDILHIKYKITDSSKTLTFINDNLNIVSKMIVEIDSLKSPTKITSVRNGEIQAIETADYNYKSNTYNYKVYNYSNEIVLNKLEYYNYNFIIDKNDFGDIVKMIWPLSKNKSITIFEYKYDKNNNWIKRIKKIIENDKEITTTIVKRNIIYKN